MDSLKSVKMMEVNGVNRDLSEAIVGMALDAEIGNIYSKDEVNGMLTESMKDVLKEFRRESNELKSEYKEDSIRLEKRMDELKSTGKWLIGLILTIGIPMLFAVYHPLIASIR